MEDFNKLNLRHTPHPEAYTVPWLQNRKSVIVREQRLITFNIRSYSDNILFYVFPMYVCHILLGRAW